MPMSGKNIKKVRMNVIQRPNISSLTSPSFNNLPHTSSSVANNLIEMNS